MENMSENKENGQGQKAKFKGIDFNETHSSAPTTSGGELLSAQKILAESELDLSLEPKKEEGGFVVGKSGNIDNVSKEVETMSNESVAEANHILSGSNDELTLQEEGIVNEVTSPVTQNQHKEFDATEGYDPNNSIDSMEKQQNENDTWKSIPRREI